MSEVFDPEKVERMRCSIARLRDKCIEVVPLVVDAADYDKLLALYREAAHANKLMARTISDLLVWRKNPKGFTESAS